MCDLIHHLPLWVLSLPREKMLMGNAITHSVHLRQGAKRVFQRKH